ncbi:cell division cycle 7-related protein kinase [Anaeramoeba ignava]|uniref:non-specific serine/threonine protein kinase n=1 Tax=Anaeramoeba ignava TaxID=1746090 RepID=A0A9Q0LLI3_ANAIG|nr:cell division cycle 7-related protein kinase [Anaeramoeba ignava]
MQKKQKIFPELKGKFNIIEKVGEGAFSKVYKAQNKQTGEIVALKRIFPTSSPERIFREAEILYKLRGFDGVCYLSEGFRQEDQITLVTPYFEFDEFRDFYHQLSIPEIKKYMISLLEALKYIHSKEIIHRDVKPGNFLYKVDKNHGMLIDFGLAQTKNDIIELSKKKLNEINEFRKQNNIGFNEQNQITFIKINENQINPIKQKLVANDQLTSIQKEIFSNPKPKKEDPRPILKAPRAGTRGFRAPEVLVKTYQQTSAIDIWSAGVILLSFLSGVYPFFQPLDDMIALAELVAIFGTEKINNMAAKFNRKVVCSNEQKGEDLKTVCKTINKYFDELNPPDSCFDLLNKMLDPDPMKRITAEECLIHPFLLDKN